MSSAAGTLQILGLVSLLWAAAAISPKAVEKTLSMVSQKVEDMPDHMTIVCHSAGCAEVKAKLAAIQEAQKVAQQKLDECSRNRKQLAADLAAAGAKRGMAEKALAKCATERSKLEAELRQCAEVDRPNAEKALAQCGKDRAALEAKLAKVVAALKKNAAGGGSKKKSSRRRRRRSKKSSSLIEVEQSVSEEDKEDDEEDQDDDEEDESSLIQMERSGSEEEMQAILSDTSELDLSSLSEAELHMQKRQLWGFLERLKAKAQELMDKVRGVDKRIADANAKLGAQDAKQKKLLMEAGVQQKKEEAKQKDLEKLEQKSQGLVGKLSAEDAKLEAAQKKVTDAMSSKEKAGADLAKEQAAETASLLQLASLVQEEHRVLHASLEQSHRNLTSKLRSNEVALSAIMSEENEEECDAARADVIKAQSALEVTGTALKACLLAKKEIKEKIDQAVELGKKVEAGLANCLKTKKVLKSKIEMCHERRDEARKKLAECLTRKKVLKVSIEKCHEKRDEARQKLAECLKRKKELTEKIAKAGGSSLMQELVDLEK